METSIWTAALRSFCDELAAAQPAPAGVAASCVTARLGLCLLLKVLQISRKREDLLLPAQEQSSKLAEFADRDIAAVKAYMQSRRDSGALRDTIGVPMSAARAAVAGLDLCAEAATEVRGPLAADLGTAALLLHGAARAILLCVDSNLKQLASEDPVSRAAAKECGELEEHAARHLEDVLDG